MRSPISGEGGFRMAEEDWDWGGRPRRRFIVGAAWTLLPASELASSIPL